MLSAYDIKELCLRGESDRLDYKRDQYALATNDAVGQSKFIKDILAFANVRRSGNDPSYILIGVDETDRHLGRVCGATALDPNIFQQLVDAKASHRIPLLVYSVDVDGACVQVIEITSNGDDPPVYLEQDLGKIKRREIYVRVGASIQVATPEEVWEMGRFACRKPTPQLEVDLVSMTGILDDGQVHGFQLKCNIDPSYGCSRSPIGIDVCSLGHSEWTVYKWYQEELSKLIFFVSLTNLSDVQADNLKIKIDLLDADGVKEVEETDWRERPVVRGFSRAHDKVPMPVAQKNLCPRETNRKFATLVLSASRSSEIKIRVQVFGRDISPIVKDFPVKICRHVVNVGVQDLHEIESQIDDVGSYRNFLAHLLSGIKSANGGEPNWDSVMTVYRKNCYAGLRHEYDCEFGG